MARGGIREKNSRTGEASRSVLPEGPGIFQMGLVRAPPPLPSMRSFDVRHSKRGRNTSGKESSSRRSPDLLTTPRPGKALGDRIAAVTRSISFGEMAAVEQMDFLEKLKAHENRCMRVDFFSFFLYFIRYVIVQHCSSK